MKAEVRAAATGEAAPRLTLAGLDHLGLVVTSLASALARYRAIHGAEARLRRRLEEEGVEVALLEVGGVTLELMEPLSAEGPIARFLERRGEGVHHVAYRVDDLHRELGAARSLGLTVVAPGVRQGVTGSPAAFLHPKETGGVLTELVESHP